MPDSFVQKTVVFLCDFIWRNKLLRLLLAPCCWMMDPCSSAVLCVWAWVQQVVVFSQQVPPLKRLWEPQPEGESFWGWRRRTPRRIHPSLLPPLTGSCGLNCWGHRRSLLKSQSCPLERKHNPLLKLAGDTFTKNKNKKKPQHKSV